MNLVHSDLVSAQRSAVANELGEIGMQMRLDRGGVIRFEGAVVAAVEEDENRHDLTEPKGWLSYTVTLPEVKQMSVIDRRKSLAEIIAITEHCNALPLVHRDHPLLRLLRD
jgi:hypothetical protein